MFYMAQLKMYWRATPSKFPENSGEFTYRKFRYTKEDIEAWASICENGLLKGNESAEEAFISRMFSNPFFKPEDIYFAELNGKPVATVTAIIRAPEHLGYVHMVAAKPECRGRGVAALLNAIAAAVFWEAKCTGAYLTTDEERIPAIKSYLRAGYLPVKYDEGMEERWLAWLTSQGYSNIEFVDENGSFVKWLLLKKVKLGIFGARRGCSYAKSAALSGLAEIAAVCDMDEGTYAGINQYCGETTKFFKNFEELLESGIDAVVLTNYFDKHAPFAIKAMEKGIHVFSETTAAVTLNECAELCRVVEKTGCTYMLAENYPYYRGPFEMKKIVESGSLGEVLYADGEYVHPMSVESYRSYTPSSRHWRAQMPSSYYLTHSLAPLMHITGTMPKKVNAKCVFSKNNYLEYEDEPIKDTAAIMLCEMDSGALFKLTGWAKFGPHGNWYRLCCENGGVEMIRNEEDKIQLTYNSWCVPEDEKAESLFEADFGEDYEQAKHCGHGGGDYRVTKEFLKCLITKKEPFFNVYRACAMAAVGILGWRSCLNGGAEYSIPDFSSEDERKKVENDSLSPFPDENGVSSYPCTMEKRK